ncbi:MAG TPA: SDR family oxidoreductase [Solirubrobacteraceae bacterium]|jgi:NAD(P)-dependent dehydrogenase (short-subunit alcohol dehydrogenase family)|nr:SDR family oxidoreductase [Solirubrobacteraceae bacterium]
MDASVVISGGTGGLGSAVTKAMLDAGWHVVVPYVDERELQRVEPHQRLTLIPADLFDADAAAAVVAAAPDPLRALVNLVGGFASGGRVHETPIEDFEKQFRLNLRPTYLLSAAAIPRMLDGGGAIVCVSTRAAVRPFSGAAGYISSKGAVLSFVDALAAEYTKDGIRANAIMPSVIDTPANRAAQPDDDHSRWVRPEQIAAVIGFLCSADAEPISGAHVPVYGRA